MPNKLHAPKQTTVEGEVQGGKVVKLKVEPESRCRNIEVCRPFAVQLGH